MRKLKEKNRSRLIQAAMGKIPCDLTVKNVQYFNVFTGEIYPAEVDVLDGFVVRVRQTGEEPEQPAETVYDGQGRYLIPGYIDTHMHVESTMMIPENLSRAILPWGTTTICTDPHEIGNVMGVEGVRFMLDNARKSALRQYVLAPSCVPAVPELESTGASFGAKEVAEILDLDNVVGIAEIMDFVGVYQDDHRMHSIIDEGVKRGMYLQGHAPYVSGKELAAYRVGGPCSDHESATAEEVVEKLRCGIHVNLRASSLIDNLKTLVAGCRGHQWKDLVSICTDDVHARDLLTVGHINKVVRKAVQAGLSGCEAIKLATFNAAREYGFDDLGAVAPGCGRPSGGGKRRLHRLRPYGRHLCVPQHREYSPDSFRRRFPHESPCERRHREGQGHRSPQRQPDPAGRAGDGTAGKRRLCGHQRPPRSGLCDGD